MNADLVNGLFEFSGGLIYLLNIKRLIKDKQIRGVSWWPVVFFSSWGAWNLYFYPSLHQWWSFYGGLFLVSINVWWLWLVWYYRKVL